MENRILIKNNSLIKNEAAPVSPSVRTVCGSDQRYSLECEVADFNVLYPSVFNISHVRLVVCTYMSLELLIY